MRYPVCMKVALVHELLTMKGGAEKVLKILAEMFPEAPIYTLLYDEQKLGDWFPRTRVRTSNVQPKLMFGRWRLNHHLYLRRFPQAIEGFDFSGFDLVISSSSAFAHGIITNGHPKHLSYIHSPARYLWDRTHDVLDRAARGPLGWFKRRHLEHTFHGLRIWDSEAAERADVLLAASKEVQRRIELYWRRESQVVYPPIDPVWLEHAPKRSTDQTYFFVASTLVPYKRIELAIEAANQLQVPLKIAGEGPDKARLQKLAGPTVELLGFQSQEQLMSLYAGAKATLFVGDEDFGLVPLESMACGTPVIGMRKGGALETIIEGTTGTFFDSPTAESLSKVMSSFDAKKFDADACRAQAQNFSRREFESSLREAIKRML